MGKIDIFHNGFVTFCDSLVTLHIVQLSHAVRECILWRGGNDALFPDDFEEDLFKYIVGVREPLSS